jgi:hypothetical protein
MQSAERRTWFVKSGPASGQALLRESAIFSKSCGDLTDDPWSKVLMQTSQAGWAKDKAVRGKDAQKSLVEKS